jgi:bifunctional non-homologous end joining protein LigD
MATAKKTVKAKVRADKSSKERAQSEKPVPRQNRAAPGKKKPLIISLPSKPESRNGSEPETFFGVRLTSPNKVLWPQDKITKRDLAEYYLKFAAWVLPHLVNRPLSLVRCPEGTNKECFFQKHPGMGTPKDLRQIPVREKNKTENYLVVDDPEGLISVAQIGALELHIWGSQADMLENADRIVFDLDPDPGVPWKRVVESAHQIRQFLMDSGLESFIKTTGGKGLHVVVPVQRRHDWDEVKEFARQVAERLVSLDPERYTANMSKAARRGKIFVDYLRNGRGATFVAPYSTRSKPGAPVSVPLSWEEVTEEMRPDQFNVLNLGERLTGLKRDPWESISSVRQSLSAKVYKALGIGGWMRH